MAWLIESLLWKWILLEWKDTVPFLFKDDNGAAADEEVQVVPGKNSCEKLMSVNIGTLCWDVLKARLSKWVTIEVLHVRGIYPRRRKDTFTGYF